MILQLWTQCRKRESMVMILAFFICWAPFGWIYTIPLLGVKEGQEESKSSTTSHVLPLLTVKFGCAILNPLVYGFENTQVSKC